MHLLDFTRQILNYRISFILVPSKLLLEQLVIFINLQVGVLAEIQKLSALGFFLVVDGLILEQVFFEVIDLLLQSAGRKFRIRNRILIVLSDTKFIFRFF